MQSKLIIKIKKKRKHTQKVNNDNVKFIFWNLRGSSVGVI